MPDPQRVGRVVSLFVDHVTASIAAEFQARRIDTMLLKGPAFVQLFYDREDDRSYTDTDLLVQCADVQRSEQALLELGFERIDRDEDWLGPEPKYSHTLIRRTDGALIDLHWRLSGSMASPEEQWAALSEHTVDLDVVGQVVRTLDARASAMLVALHNAHHGTGRPSTLTDLDRAVDRLDLQDWLDATCLADRLAAAGPFAAGLRLTAAGDALADRLQLERPASVEMWLKANPSSYGAWVLDRFAQTPTVRGRLRICLQVVLPPRVVMYRAFALARRGRIGLALAYIVRPFRLVAHAAPALRDWTRARRALRA